MEICGETSEDDEHDGRNELVIGQASGYLFIFFDFELVGGCIRFCLNHLSYINAQFKN